MADDPLVPRPANIPWLVINQFDLVDSAADEDLAQYSLGKGAVSIERNGLVSGWVRRNVGKMVTNDVAIDAFSKSLPLVDELGALAAWGIPAPWQTTDVIGDRAFFGYGPATNYAIISAVNDWLRANFSQTTDGPMAYGYRLTTGKQTETGATTGATELTLPAVAATEKVIAAAFVTAFTGTDATLKVQRDDVWAMTTPEDIISFTQFTDVGFDYGETAVGANAETKYRFDLSTSGGITSITFVVLAGIVPG